MTAKRKPIFVDLNGDTVRLDPRNKNDVHVSVFRLAIYAQRGQAAEVFLSDAQAEELARALKLACKGVA